jgi:short-subunit dehydrogenase
MWMNKLPSLKYFLPVLILGIVLQLAGCATYQLSKEEEQSVAGKTFVVTGASSGFGRGVALKLAPMRANLVLAARRTETLNEVAAEVRAAGGTPLVVTADVSSLEDMKRLAANTVARFGKIDVWINNAAVGVIGRFDQIPIEDHARIVDVNIKSVYYGTHIAMSHFLTQGYGTIVNIGSVESEVPLAYQSSYAASKAAVLSLGRAINEEIRLNNLPVKIATVMPRATDTPFFTHAADYSGGTPRMAALDDPQKVVDAIVWTALHPQEELAVGWKAKGAAFSHRIFPDLTERISGNISHRMQIETAPPAPPTKGSLYTPMQEGTGVDGGIRARMERQDETRKQLRRQKPD